MTTTITKKVNWTNSKGGQVEVTIEMTKGTQDKMINADGDMINMGQETVESIYIEVQIDGKYTGRSYNAPRSIISDPAYKAIVAKGAYARLGDAYITEELFNLVMAAIAEANEETEETTEYVEIKADEVAKEEKQAQAEREEAANYAKQIKNGLCPKCGSYCHGDCEAN